MTMKRLSCLLLAIVMLFCTAMPVFAQEDQLILPVVRSAPLVRADAPRNGMARVYLSSMGTVTNLDVIVAGSYTVEGATKLTLSNGQQVSISFNTYSGQITMNANGRSYAMGTEMAFRRHQATGESGLRIAQAKRPNNLYPGDLQLVARTSGSGYKLYPIVHIYIEYYLYGVVPYEMSSSWPMEALKAQAVAARTYTLNRMEGRTSYIYDLVDTASDQVFYGYSGSQTNATRAVDATKGIVIMNGGKLSGTYYTASNGGQTEAVANVWGSKLYPYLCVKDDPFDLANPNSNKRRLTVYPSFHHDAQSSTLQSILSAKARSVYGSSAAISTINSITPHTPKYAAPSRLYTMMDFGVTFTSGQTGTLTFSIFDELESQLDLSINSNKNELWSIEREGADFVIRVRRYGHGVGMSQRGAQQMANMGYTYDQILGFYYEGCERIQHTFTHTILPSIGSGDDPVVSTEAPATIAPETGCNARIQLVGVGDVLPIRYTPAHNGRILIAATNGAYVNVLSYGTEWTLIRYGEINGYVPTEHLVIDGTPPAGSGHAATSITRWGTVTGSTSLNLREGGSYGSDVIGSIPGGGIVAILSYGDAWSKVQYGQQTGYVVTSYLTLSTVYPQDIESSGSSAMVSLPGGIGSAPLRSSASTSATIILYVPHGTQVTVHSNDGSWCRVSVSGVSGYILSSALDFDASGVTPTEPPLDDGEMYAIVASEASTLNLRTGPGTSYDVIAQIPRGTQIVVTSYGAEWCAVRWGSLTGYVMTMYLSFDADTPTSAPSSPPSVTNVPFGAAALTLVSTDMYAEASATSEHLLMIPYEETVMVLSYGDVWSQITYVGLTGYVQTSALRLYQDMMTETPATETPAPGDDTTPAPVPTTAATPVPTYLPSNASATVILNAQLRVEPDTSSALVATIPAGTVVRVCATGISWCQIEVDGMSGWVLTSQLHIHAENEPTEAPEPTSSPEGDAEEGAFGATPDSEHDGLVAWIVPTVNSVNLRTSASTEAEILTGIAGSSSILVLDAGETWSRVRYGSMSGYVFSRYITYTEPMEVLGMRYIATAVDPLGLRTEPSTEGKLLTRMDRGDTVLLLEIAGDWSYVQYGQLLGYCASRYLSVDPPQARVTDDTPLLDYTLTEVDGWTAIVNQGGKDSVFVRKWCSTEAPEMFELQPDTRVTVLQKGRIWCQISFEGEEGYCLTSQLTLLEPAQ